MDMREEACKLLKYQREQGIKAVPISVKFSRYHIGEEGFVERLCDIMNRYGLPHKLLQVESTELIEGGSKVGNYHVSEFGLIYGGIEQWKIKFYGIIRSVKAINRRQNLSSISRTA